MEKKPIHKLIRLFYDGKLSDFVVLIRHRIEGEEKMKEINGSSIICVRRNGFYYRENKVKKGEELIFIPSHRIVEVRRIVRS